MSSAVPRFVRVRLASIRFLPYSRLWRETLIPCIGQIFLGIEIHQSLIWKTTPGPFRGSLAQSFATLARRVIDVENSIAHGAQIKLIVFGRQLNAPHGVCHAAEFKRQVPLVVSYICFKQPVVSLARRSCDLHPTLFVWAQVVVVPANHPRIIGIHN
jgi:hypothetical protein